MALDPAVEPFVPAVEPVAPKMSPPESKRVKRAGKEITKRTLGPEDGYSFKIEETFIKRHVKTPSPPVVRTGPRPAPPHLRFRKVASTEETQTSTASIQDPAELNPTSEPSPLKSSANSLRAMTDCAREPLPTTTQTVTDGCKTHSTKDSSPTTTETVLRRRKTNSSMTVAVIATEAAASTVSTPRCASDSDGGVELPLHPDTTNARGIVFGGQVDDNQQTSHNDGPELGAPKASHDSPPQPTTDSVTQDKPESDTASIANGGGDSEPLLSVLDSLDCCNQS